MYAGLRDAGGAPSRIRTCDLRIRSARCAVTPDSVPQYGPVVHAPYFGCSWAPLGLHHGQASDSLPVRTAITAATPNRHERPHLITGTTGWEALTAFRIWSVTSTELWPLHRAPSTAMWAGAASHAL